MLVNDLKLPSVLSNSIKSGEWMALSHSPRLGDVFSEADIVHPSFYDEEGLDLENASWPQENDPLYIGTKDSPASPGNIDPTKSVLIADLGPDMPIALDYRTPDSPSVVYLTGDSVANWIEVAPDVETLIKMLGKAAW